mgnify:CR=1 FL=1
MADKYTIQINPQIGSSDGQKMENELNTRFANVARKFGTHLKNSLTKSLKVGAGAGLAGIIGMVATNPFEKVKEDLKNLLETGDNIVTRARQFGTPVEKMADIVRVANSVGLDIDLALQNFASKLQEAREYKAGDTAKSPALINYVNKKDLVENFYDLVRTASKLPAQERGAFLGKIYGDKMQNKLAEFFDQDIDKRIKELRPRGISPREEAKRIQKIADLEDEYSKKRARRESEILLAKSRVITKGTINIDDAVERAKANREVRNLSQFEIYARQAALQEELLKSIDEIRAKLMDTLFPLLEKLVGFIEKLIELSMQAIDWLRKIAKKTLNIFGG